MLERHAQDEPLEPIITPIPYTKEQAAHIRESAEHGAVVECPACRHILTYGPPIDHKGHRVRELYCSGCNRVVVLTQGDGTH